MRREPRSHLTNPNPRGQLIAGMGERQRKKLELLTHQIAFFANRLNESVRKHDLIKPKSSHHSASPSKDLTILIELVCDLQDLNEDILYNQDLKG